ncbi:adipokinetic hormone/corazonin-related peptide receptor variant I-like [Lutzomyia longipalpis]|uniref:adipokinetic hormone/corazonin-related peptide receptor variant I-like n=1 Tax=Lutzomyia longipalpis TaxID=7200 RepID=UPI0024843559|nr:adipokinetic hormone/corazonin-related peptide receptor variant I-like [Lutzomyia longipalpis]
MAIGSENDINLSNENFFSDSTTNLNSSGWSNRSHVELIAPPGYTESTIPVISVYCVMLVIALTGNLSVVITLFRTRRHRRSRVSLMIFHLAVADLMVACIMIPLEIGWRITVEWYAGNIACKIFLFLRAFCLYLSSNVLVCVSLDRCFAVVYPLRVTDARKRGKCMLGVAWLVATLYSIPQSIIFHVQQHPEIPGFWQCVSFGSFSTPRMEAAYNLFCLTAMYFGPLAAISIAYTAIVCEISNRSDRSRAKDDGGDRTASGALRLRCNALTHIERARQRTFRLTITIVLVFIWCWTPYAVMTLWYTIDKESAVKVDTHIQDGLFLMAVSNSCVNPLVYGSYAIKTCRYPWTSHRTNNIRLLGNSRLGLHRRSTGTYTRTSAVTRFTVARENIDLIKNTIPVLPQTFIDDRLDQQHYHLHFHNTRTVSSVPRVDNSSCNEIANMPDECVRQKTPSNRITFHSDPTPHMRDTVESFNELTRSLDTGGWR